MTPEDFDDAMPPAKRRPARGRGVLFAGVAGACALGAGLGLWARPAMNERQMAVAAPAAEAPKASPRARRLQIVVDNTPAPIGVPIEVLAGAPARPAPVALPAAPREPEPRAPVRPPQGLTRIRSVAPPEPAPAPSRPAVAKARAEQAHAELARIEAAKVARAKAEAHRIELARASRAARLEQVRLARAEAARLEKVRLARTEAAKMEQVRLARAEARGRAEARAEAKAQALALAREESRRRTRLASLAHAAARAAPHKALPAAKVELARLDRGPGRKARREPKVEPALARKPPRAVEPSYRTRTIQAAPLPHPGLMRVSTTPRTDPSLSAAERQLARAYQGARAAGVPDAQLQRQQQRWLAARSAAAREAPWAVHDVYLARIAELNGMARDAHPDGY